MTAVHKDGCRTPQTSGSSNRNAVSAFFVLRHPKGTRSAAARGPLGGSYGKVRKFTRTRSQRKNGSVRHCDHGCTEPSHHCDRKWRKPEHEHSSPFRDHRSLRDGRDNPTAPQHDGYRERLTAHEVSDAPRRHSPRIAAGDKNEYSRGKLR